MGERGKKYSFFILKSYQLKIRYYHCKVFYANHIVTTKEKSVVDTPKVKIKESKHTSIKSYQITKEVKQERRK